MSARKYINPEIYSSDAQIPSTQTKQIPWHNPSIASLCQDSSNPSYFRPTISVFPNSKKVFDESKIPLGLVISPADIVDVPCVDQTNCNLLRCTKCASYLSPYAKVIDGNAFICPFCGNKIIINNADKNYSNLSNRIEFKYHVYDMLAPKSFSSSTTSCSGCNLFLMVDISEEAVSTGFSLQMLTSIKSTIQYLPEHMTVGFATFDNVVTFYDFRRKSTFIISDLTQPIAPSNPVGKIGECKEEFNAIIDEVIESLNSVRPHGHCCGSALKITEIALKGIGGIVICGCCGYTNYGPMKIKNRTVNSDTPESKLTSISEVEIGRTYRSTGFHLNRSSLSIHLFQLASPTQQISEISIIGFICRLTGGKVHYYQNLDPQLLYTDIYETCTKNYLWDSSMRLRCSEGIKIKTIICNCSLRGQTVYFPVVSNDNSLAFELEIDSSFKGQNALFQAAFLWVNNSNQKMIRIFTFEFPTSGDQRQIRDSIDEGALSVYLAKLSSSNLILHGFDVSISSLKKLYSNLLLTHQLKSTNYIVHSLLCSKLLRPRTELCDIDKKMEICYNIQSWSFIETLLFIYPRMFAVDTNTEELPLNQESFSYGFCFLIHTQNRIYIWVSPSISQQYLKNVFGVNSVSELTQELKPQNDTNESKILYERINQCYQLSSRYLPIEVIPPGSPNEYLFNDFLVDCSKACGTNLQAFTTQFTV